MSEKDEKFEVTDRRRSKKASEPGAGASKPEVSADHRAAEEPQQTTPSEEVRPEENAAGKGGEAAHLNEESPNVSGAPPRDDGAQQDEGAPDNSADFQMPEITTLGLVQFTMATLAQQAWYDLGLQANPATGKTQSNLPEARLAIDSVAALLPVVASRLGDTARRDMQNLVATLRLNYVEQTKRQN